MLYIFQENVMQTLAKVTSFALIRVLARVCQSSDNARAKGASI